MEREPLRDIDFYKIGAFSLHLQQIWSSAKEDIAVTAHPPFPICLEFVDGSV
jgi:hypothetical protein